MVAELGKLRVKGVPSRQITSSARTTSVPRRPERSSAKEQKGHMENRAPQVAIPALYFFSRSSVASLPNIGRRRFAAFTRSKATTLRCGERPPALQCSPPFNLVHSGRSKTQVVQRLRGFRQVGQNLNRY